MTSYDYPIIVVGAGAGGLVVAIGAAKAGKRVLLIDKGTWGGDCTNYGCVPSKALIGSAHLAHGIRRADALGIRIPDVQVDAAGALARVRAIRSEIRRGEEPQALARAGVDTLTGTASFHDAHSLEIIDAEGAVTRVSGKQIVLAVGSHPVVPKVQGLSACHFLTNETIFDLERVPRQLIVLGGGPIGSELAQAMQRLGSQVTVIQHRQALLMREEPEVQAIVQKSMRADGVEIVFESELTAARPEGNGYLVEVKHLPTGMSREIACDHILVSAGRRPSLAGLKLQRAGVDHTDRGTAIDKYGRTNQKHIYAIGDAVGAPFFTHRAENHARSVLASLLLPGPWKRKLDLAQAMPRVTFTAPEVASAGLTESEAIQQFGERGIATYTIPMSEVDRAICVGETEGLVKIVTRKWSSKILGVALVGSRAGEMLGEVTLAMLKNIPLRSLSHLIHPYPIFSQGIRKAADRWLTQTIAGTFRGKRG